MGVVRPSRASRSLCDPSLMERGADTWWDHLVDVPLVVAQTGAKVYGSETTLNICRARGVPEDKLTLIGHGQRCDLAKSVSVRVIRPKHKEPVGSPGFYTQVPAVLAERAHYLCGDVFAFLFDINGLRLLKTRGA